MILPIHIIVATLSLISAGVLYYQPSKLKLNVTYILTAVMLVTGFYLILTREVNLTRTCIVGLTGLAIISYSIVSAKSRMAEVPSK